MHPRPATRRARRLALLLAASAAPFAAVAQPLGTAFTYQGQLTESGQPASGLYDLQVCLFDSPSNPVPIGCAPDFGDVPVEAGVFTLALDFGSAPFAGQHASSNCACARVRPPAATPSWPRASWCAPRPKRCARPWPARRLGRA